MKKFLILAAAALLVVVVFSVPRAEALADTLGFVRVYTKTCTTTAARIAPSSGFLSAKALRLWNNTSTPIYIGGSDVASTVTGWPICTDTANCEQASFPIDSNPVVYCRTGSGSASLLVFVGF